jgi:hypothetical protein
VYIYIESIFPGPDPVMFWVLIGRSVGGILFFFVYVSVCVFWGVRNLFIWFNIFLLFFYFSGGEKKKKVV